MTTNATKTCTACGKEFKTSRTGYTVRCTDCRSGGRATAGERRFKAVACGRCGHVHTTLKCDRCGF